MNDPVGITQCVSVCAMWRLLSQAVGCILYELITRRPLFAGRLQSICKELFMCLVGVVPSFFLPLVQLVKKVDIAGNQPDTEAHLRCCPSETWQISVRQGSCGSDSEDHQHPGHAHGGVDLAVFFQPVWFAMLAVCLCIYGYGAPP